MHRLDAGTTGVMVVAKSEHAYSVLKQAFRDRAVDKRYHALVQGHPDPLRGTIDAPIDRHPSGDGRFAVVSGGRESVTHYDTLEAFRAASLLEVRLETGRTHQIRVHMQAVRHPCVGDRLYGADPVLAARLGLTRQWLHAVRLGFAHPADGRRVEFTSEYPADLAQALEILAAESLTAGHPEVRRKRVVPAWRDAAADRAGDDDGYPELIRPPECGSRPHCRRVVAACLKEAVLHGGEPDPARRGLVRAPARPLRVLHAGRRGPAEGDVCRVRAHRHAGHCDHRPRQCLRRL